jgi:hypothetical protein
VPIEKYLLIELAVDGTYEQTRQVKVAPRGILAFDRNRPRCDRFNYLQAIGRARQPESLQEQRSKRRYLIAAGLLNRKVLPRVACCEILDLELVHEDHSTIGTAPLEPPLPRFPVV